MNGMEKTIVFVGGVKEGVDRFEHFIKNDFRVKNINVRNSFGKMLPEKFDLSAFNVDTFDKLEEVISQCEDFDYETLATGEYIRDFLGGSSQVLIFHDTSESVRKTLCKIGDGAGLNIHRIFFGYKDDLPSEFDFNVNPNRSDFENIIFRILNNEERISM